MKSTNTVERFIRKFQDTSKTQNIIEVFTEGCCYWFAVILHERFPDSSIVYDPIYGHFMIDLHGRLYDITGDVTGVYSTMPIEEIAKDDLELGRIIDYCIEFNK